MRGTSKRKPTLMPAVSLAALSLAVSLPVVSNSVHAAPPVSYQTVTIRPGDTVWSVAERKTPTGGDVQAMVDQIIGANHLATASVTVGQRLRVPQ
jgi:Tfp pilus assembly protein FimV